MLDNSDHIPSAPLRQPDAEPVSERLSAFVSKLETEAKRRVDKRVSVEKRWIEDLQQYHGVYSHEVTEKLRANEGASRVFINLTATKTEAMEARLWDLLFPTDDRNWAIQPTPVPELTEQAEAEIEKVDEAKAQADLMQGEMQSAAASAQQTKDPAQKAVFEQQAQVAEAEMRLAEETEAAAQEAADKLHEVLNVAKRRCNLMQEEIDDQLTTSVFAAEARDAIGDACKIGIGILKGPVIGERRKQRWIKVQDEAGQQVHVLREEQDTAPAVYRVDPWAFFPDPDVRRIADSEGFYERHMLSKQQLRKLARNEDIDDDVVRELLRTGPTGDVTPSFLADLHSLTSQTDADLKDRYHVWEYRGPVEAEDMLLLATAFADEAMAAEMVEVDPLAEIQAVVKFCQGKVLSFALHPMDSGEPIYSAFTIRGDEASVYGFGIPYIMRHPQSVLNAAYRMMMDNSGLGTGPQIVIDKSKVSPQDGDWTLKPRKVWYWQSDGLQKDGKPPFATFAIDTHQGELANIIALASQTIDEVTAMPALAQGEQGAGVTKTAQGMALLMNSANVTFRRIVKNFDDDVTLPVIRRLYHWNMQFSRKDEIKGDFEVKARGSSVLLVREMQAQNLLMVAQLFGDHPTYGPMLKHGDLLRQIFRAHMISADEIVKSEREYQQWLAEQKEQTDPAAALQQAEVEAKMAAVEATREETQSRVALGEMEWNTRLKIAQMSHDATMTKLAESLNMQREDLDARLASKNAELASKERGLAVETAMAQRTGVSSGGAV